MDTLIPSVEDIRGKLLGLSMAQLEELSTKSGVPLPTLSKIRYGQTANPGIETVRLFLPRLAELIGAEGAPEVPAPAQAEGVRDAA